MKPRYKWVDGLWQSVSPQKLLIDTGPYRDPLLNRWRFMQVVSFNEKGPVQKRSEKQ